MELLAKANGNFFVSEEPIEMGGDYWNKTKIQIYDKDKNQIGEFTRGYPYYGAGTFEPFFLNDQWYALYSADYQKTQVMTLPDCEFWCEVENDKFCPVEHYVPQYYDYTFVPKDSEDLADIEEYRITQNFHKKELDDGEYTHYQPFGFVSGCWWGDDSTWKLQLLGLSDIHDKVITKEERFGYLSIPGNLSLRESLYIDMYDLNRDGVLPSHIIISQQNTYEFDTGERYVY